MLATNSISIASIIDHSLLDADRIRFRHFVCTEMSLCFSGQNPCYNILLINFFYIF